jgi:hypothetical protein
MEFLNSVKNGELGMSLQNLLIGHKYALILRYSLKFKIFITRLKRTDYCIVYLIASLTRCIGPTSSGVRHYLSLLDNDVYV